MVSAAGKAGRISIRVDDGMCMGARSCIHAAPASFALDATGVAQGLAEPGDSLDAVLEAARACPNFAITVLVDGEVVFDPDRQ